MFMHIKHQRQSAISLLSTMKSTGAVLRAFFAFAFLVVASGLSDDTWSTASNATGRAMQSDSRCILHMDDIYRVSSRGVNVEKLNYCSNRACPNWKCQDDSAIIHGTCCGCPNIFGGSNFKKMSKINKRKFECGDHHQVKTMLTKNHLSTNIEKKNELKRSVDFIESQFDDFHKETKSKQSEIKAFKTENENNYNANKYLSDGNSIINIKNSFIDQIHFRNLVYIKGIPLTKNKKYLKEIVKTIGLKTNTKTNVIMAFRFRINSSSNSIIVAKLETIEMKKNLVYNSKISKLTANNICNNWPKKNIYVDDVLRNR